MSERELRALVADNPSTPLTSRTRSKQRAADELSSSAVVDPSLDAAISESPSTRIPQPNHPVEYARACTTNAIYIASRVTVQHVQPRSLFIVSRWREWKRKHGRATFQSIWIEPTFRWSGTAIAALAGVPTPVVGYRSRRPAQHHFRLACGSSCFRRRSSWQRRLSSSTGRSAP